MNMCTLYNNLICIVPNSSDILHKNSKDGFIRARSVGALLCPSVWNYSFRAFFLSLWYSLVHISPIEFISVKGVQWPRNKFLGDGSHTPIVHSEGKVYAGWNWEQIFNRVGKRENLILNMHIEPMDDVL